MEKEAKRADSTKDLIVSDDGYALTKAIERLSDVLEKFIRMVEAK